MMPRRAEMSALGQAIEQPLPIERVARAATSTQNDWKLLVPYAGSATARSPAMPAIAFG